MECPPFCVSSLARHHGDHEQDAEEDHDGLPRMVEDPFIHASLSSWAVAPLLAGRALSLRGHQPGGLTPRPDQDQRPDVDIVGCRPWAWKRLSPVLAAMSVKERPRRERPE